MRASCDRRTKPWFKASASTACVETTTRIPWRTLFQMACSVHRSTLSSPVRIRVFTDGICEAMTSCCWRHRATVGTKNQVSCIKCQYASRARSDFSQRTFSESPFSSSSMIHRIALSSVKVWHKVERIDLTYMWVFPLPVSI